MAQPTDGLSPKARALLDSLGVDGMPKVRVISGRRDPDRNARVGGAKGSRHLHGDALDIDVAGWSDAQKAALLQRAIASGARGVGIYPHGRSIHFDVRDAPAMWGFSPAGHQRGMTLEQAPAWARGSLAGLFKPGAQPPVVAPIATPPVAAPPPMEPMAAFKPEFRTLVDFPWQHLVQPPPVAAPPPVAVPDAMPQEEASPLAALLSSLSPAVARQRTPVAARPLPVASVEFQNAPTVEGFPVSGPDRKSVV